MRRKKVLNCVVLSCLNKPLLIWRWFRRYYFSKLLKGKEPTDLPLPGEAGS